MRTLTIGSLAVALVLAAALLAHAAGIGLKPGLWEVHLVKQVVDGRDMTAQITRANARMQQALKNMPPEQRARLEAMLKQHGVNESGNGSFRICITPEMAKRDTPVLDREGRCKPIDLRRSGNRTTYTFDCTSHGVTTTGKGVATIGSERVTTETDATTQSETGEKHVMHTESEMTYLGSDCGDVKPPASQE